MATSQATGRSREELNAAAAALTGAMHEVDCSDAAAFLARRAKQFEVEAMDAPPASQVAATDDALVLIIGFVGATAAATVLARAGVPPRLAEEHAKRVWGRALADPLHREELLQGSRHVLAGRCSCGEGDIGHDPHDDGVQ